MRLGPRAAARAVLVLVAIAVGQARLAAQQRDTLPPPDTTAARDTVLPPPTLVPWPGSTSVGWADAVWTWNRDDLARDGAFTILDLLRSVPGVTTFRAGVFLQPEAATFMGGGAGRTEIEIDGFALDPLAAATIDLSTLELANLEQVRVERGVGRLRIRLRTLEPEDARPYSRIEAGVGEPRANMFRGLLLAPRVVAGPLAFAVERIEAQGSGRLRPADNFATWVKWGVLGTDRGLQLEWRRNSLSREPESAVPLELERHDFVIRARNRFPAGVVGEAWAAWSAEATTPLDPALPDSLVSTLERSSRQVGLRAAIERDRFGADAALRLRSEDALARWQTDLGARFSPIGRLQLSARLSAADWRPGRRTLEQGFAAAVRAATGIRFVGEFSTGETGAPVRGDSLRTTPAFSDRTAWRAGLEISRFGIDAGAAALHVETDSVAAFGLPGDSAAVLPGGAVDGWEASARVPLLRDWLAASISYSTWLSGARWAWLPASSLRAALDLHAIPLPSGNLEITGRFEILQRGALFAPNPLPGELPLVLPARTQANAYLQIRIIEVRLFIRFDDIQAGDVADLPDLAIRGPRLVYGVKWDFWN